MTELRISEKKSGELARRESCPRCLWPKTKAKNALQQEAMV